MSNVPSNLQKSEDWIKDATLTNAKISASAAIASTKLANWSANRNAGGNKLTNLGNATADTDAVNLGQLNDAITASAAGLAIKEPVRVASTADVTTSYNSTNGAAGRGQHTGCPDSLDGVSLVAGDRLLLKNQSPGDENGIFVVTTVGSGSNGVWDRAEDFDEDSEVIGSVFVFVQEGSTNADSQWVLTTNDDITIGGASGTALSFTQFGAGQTYTADEVTLELTGSEFSVKAGGVGTTEIADDAVTSDKIAAGAVDATALGTGAVSEGKIGSAAVTEAKIGTGAVTTDKLGADAVTGAKIQDGAVDSEHLAAESVSVPALALHVQAFTGDGSTSTFTLSTACYQAGAMVAVSGSVLFGGEGFTVTGGTGGGTSLTLSDSFAPDAAEKFVFRGFKQ